MTGNPPQVELAPAIRSVLTNTDGPFAEIFREFATPGQAPAATVKSAELKAGSPVVLPTRDNSRSKGAAE